MTNILCEVEYYVFFLTRAQLELTIIYFINIYSERFPKLSEKNLHVLGNLLKRSKFCMVLHMCKIHTRKMFHVLMGRKGINNYRKMCYLFINCYYNVGRVDTFNCRRARLINLKVSISVWSMYRNGGKEGPF